MSTSTDRLVAHVAEALNEMADYLVRDEPLPNHTPSSAGYWFYGLAREQRALCRGKKFRKLLSPCAREALNRRPSAWGRERTVQVNGIWRAA